MSARRGAGWLCALGLPFLIMGPAEAQVPAGPPPCRSLDEKEAERLIEFLMGQAVMANACDKLLEQREVPVSRVHLAAAEAVSKAHQEKVDAAEELIRRWNFRSGLSQAAVFDARVARAKAALPPVSKATCEGLYAELLREKTAWKAVAHQLSLIPLAADPDPVGCKAAAGF